MLWADVYQQHLDPLSGSFSGSWVLSTVLAAVPGVVEHGLFPPSLVSEVLVGLADGSVKRLLPG